VIARSLRSVIFHTVIFDVLFSAGVVAVGMFSQQFDVTFQNLDGRVNTALLFNTNHEA